jgi:hypothetical protein
MKVHEETIEKAAASGMGKDSIIGAMRTIFRGLAPNWLTDDQINNETPRPPKVTNPPTQEQALAERHGAGFVQHQHAVVAAAVKSKEKAAAAIKVLEGRVEKAFLDTIECMRRNLPEAIISGLKTAGVGTLFWLVVKGEVALLVVAVADWMNIERIASNDRWELSAIGAVVLTFLGLLTHWAWEHRQKVEGRYCGIALAAVALMLSFLRSAQASFDNSFDRLVFLLFCLSLSIGAPIGTAWALTYLWPTLRQFLASLVDMGGAFVTLWREKAKVAEQQALIAAADHDVETVLGRFTKAYEDAVFGAERRWELAQAARRTEDANLAEAEIHLEFARNKKPVKSYFQWIAWAIGALILLWGIGAHAEPVDAQPVWWTVVCDRSDTSAELSCTKDRIAGALEAWAEKAVLSHKGMFKVLIIGRDIADVEEFFKISAPLAKDIKAPLKKGRDRWKTDALAQLDAKLLPNKVGAASAIVDTIYAASFQLAGLPGEKHLTVISDFREYSLGHHLDFEHKVPAPEEFVQFLKTLARPPDLLNVNVVACGFHVAAPAGGRLDTSALLKVRAAWEAAFKFWGVKTSIPEECAF